MTHFCHAAIMAALLAGVTTANAQTTVITREPVESRTVVTTEPLQLTPVQRRTIYRTIVRERVSPAQPTVEYRLGTTCLEACISTRYRRGLQSRSLQSALTNTWW